MRLSRANKRGENNPNYKDAGWHICQTCGVDFKNYNKTRKFCSVACYHKSRKRKERPPKKKRVKRTCPYCDSPIVNSKTSRTCGDNSCQEKHRIATLGPKPVTKCKNCGKMFEHHRSAKRKYCSYDCSIKDGTAFRAGRAAARSNNTKYKKDHNHDEIVSALEKCGVQVIDTSHMGRGFPDLICCSRRETHLVEIKNPETHYGKRGLNGLQKKFAEEWRGGPVYIIRTVDDVEAFANGRLDDIDYYGGD